MFLIKNKLIIPVVLCLILFLAYVILSITRYNYYGAGYDLAIANQAVWQYSNFQLPITTVHAFTYTSLLSDHIEIIYLFLAPFYWIWNDPRMLLILQAFFISFSGLAIYLIAVNKKIKVFIAYALMFGYLAFYGIQNAIWSDVHSIVFGVGLLAWFIYFLEIKKDKQAIVFLILAILCKENIALITLAVGFIYFLYHKRKIGLYVGMISIFYLIIVFGVYFPYLTENGYRYSNNLFSLSDINPIYLIDSESKRGVIFYSFASYGFLSILAPIFLIPAVLDLAVYFVLADHIKAGHDLFLHYRIALGLLFIWPVIIAISRFKILNKNWLVVYLLFFTIASQYILHLPLSYLAKSWFWKEPDSVKNINEVLRYLPRNAYIVSQNNITSHISNREHIFTLWPDKKAFNFVNSPCQEIVCDWFKWSGNPQYLIVDTSNNWDARHFLTDRKNFINGIDNMEKERFVEVYKKFDTTVLYKILKQP